MHKDIDISKPHVILSTVLPNAFMALSYYFWMTDYKHATNDSVITGDFAADFYAKIELSYIEYLVEQGSLVAFRKFDDFFAGRTEGTSAKKRDDIFVDDFTHSFPIGRFLDEHERREINKTVAHLTSHNTTDKQKGVNSLLLSFRFMNKFESFCDHIIESEEKTLPDEVIQATIAVRSRINQYQSTFPKG